MAEIKDIITEAERAIPEFETDFEKFQYFVGKLKKKLQGLEPIFIGLMYNEYWNKQIDINWKNPDYKKAFELYTEIELLMLTGDIDWEQWETEYIKIYLDRIHNLLAEPISEAFKTAFENTYNTILDLNEQTFWERVFEVKMSF